LVCKSSISNCFESCKKIFYQIMARFHDKVHLVKIREQLLNKQLLNVDDVVDQQINFLNDKILLLIPVR
jgi:hypothetical protein